VVGHHRLPRGERAGRKGSLLRARNVAWLRARQAAAVATYLAAGLLMHPAAASEAHGAGGREPFSGVIADVAGPKTKANGSKTQLQETRRVRAGRPSNWELFVTLVGAAQVRFPPPLPPSLPSSRFPSRPPPHVHSFSLACSSVCSHASLSGALSRQLTLGH
jgi:uncharacterized membrane protein